ncbi:MAG: glycosyltransferase family 4 protein [Lachnospiraceae bacterium]|uniref:glycosyltransferase family 4 protein n=1 Tax=Candidatus Merdisoma sp. JLR.KK011 TaxID=3114299 RepID=UPI002FF30BD2|nr:glycosyltransferase family 4 protein [Lachnospiraceae bacterium]
MKECGVDADKKVLLYASGNIINTRQTGGVKRFIELAQYSVEKEIKIGRYKIYSDLCCSENNDILKKAGLKAKYHMHELPQIKLFKFIPPEACIFLRNKCVFREIKKEKYDAVIVFDVPPAIGLCLARVKNIILMIRKDMIGYEKVSVNGQINLKKRLKIAMQWLSEGITLLKAKTVICQCEYDKNVLLKRHGFIRKVIEAKFRIQINNVNPSWIINKSLTDETTGLNRDKSEFWVCFIGEFEDLRKGQELFLKAAESIVKKEGAVRFILIGGGKKLNIYKEKYNHPYIKFLGRMDNPLSLLKKTDMLVVPSLADSCPNTIMEALYNEVPVIGSNAGGIPEMINDDSAVFDLEWSILEKKITQIYRDKVYYKELKEKQKKRKEELSFNWTEIIFKLLING